MNSLIQFILLGLGVGGVYALVGASVTVTHRGSGVVNFAAAAVGAFGTFFYYNLHIARSWPIFPSLIAAGVCVALIGALNHIVVMRPLANAPLTTRIIATLGLMIATIGVTNLLFAPTGNATSVPSVLPSGVATIGGIRVGLDSLLIAPVAIAVTMLLLLIQHRSKFGLATSAVAEDRVIAATMGVSPDLVAAINWALGAVIGMLGVLLLAPIEGLGAQTLALVIVPAMACALVGGFDSLAMTLATGIALGVAESVITKYASNRAWTTVVPIVVILVLLTLRGSTLPERSTQITSLPRVTPGILTWKPFLWLAASILAISIITQSWLGSITISILLGIVTLSVVVVTGFGGQISLAQLSFAGIGAVFTAFLVTQLGFPMWVAIATAGVLTVPVGLVVAVPAIRTRGSSLAIASLAFASLVDALVITNPSVAGKVSGNPMSPLQIFGLNFDPLVHPRSFAVLCLIVFAVCLAAVTNLRRGTSGRRMLAARANERAAMALGISVRNVKLYAFGFAALLAALGGAFLEAELTYPDFTIFTVFGSITTVLNGVLGGIGWPSGAAVGGVLSTGGVASQAISKAVSPGNWILVLVGVSAIAVVLQSAAGLIPLWTSQLRALWNAMRTLGSRRSTVPRAEPVVIDTGAIGNSALGSSIGSVTLEAADIVVQFGTQRALDRVSLSLAPGEIVGLIGPNGAGKSTLLEVLTGFQRALEGQVSLNGLDITRIAAHARSRLGIGRSFQSLELFDDMTVLENVCIAAEQCGWTRYVSDLIRPKPPVLSDAAELAIDFFGLAPYVNRVPAELDYATRRLVGIARAVAGGPGVLLLDEPAVGLDRAARSELGHLLRELVSKIGLGVLLVEHDMELVFGLCDRIVALDVGRVICSGTAKQVRDSELLRASYLGPDIENLQRDNVRATPKRSFR